MATPNLALFPSGRKATKLYSVLPTDGTGDFTVARASQGSEINSDLKIQNVANNVPRFTYDTLGGCPSLLTEPQSENLVKYPISFGNSYWTKNGATIEGDATTVGAEIITGGLELTNGSAWDFNFGAVTFSGAGASFNANDDRLVEITLLTVGQLYLCEIDITTNTATSFNIDNNGFPIYKSSTTTGVQSFYFTATSTNFRIIQIGAGAVDVASLSVKEVQGFSSPHVDYPTSAFKLVEDTSTGTHRVYKSTLIPIGTSTVSVIAKANERDYIVISNSSDGTTVYYNLSAGVIDAESVGWDNTKITPLADGFYRCEATLTTIAAKTLSIYLADTSSTVSYTGDGTSGVYIFGGQLEQQSVATSFMYNGTEGATTIRYADVVKKLSIASSILSPTEGTMFFDLSFAFPSGSRSLGLAYTDISNYYEVYLLASNQVRVDVNNSLLMLSSPIDVTTQNKIAFAYSSGDQVLYVNGVSEATASTTTLPTSVNDYYLGNTLGGSQIGGIKSNQLYTTRLSNAELATLTTI